MSALPSTGGSPGGWRNADWNSILYAIHHKNCTPFLGAGAAAGILPLGGQLAADWAREYEFPFYRERKNLMRVAQYVSVDQDNDVLRRQIWHKLAWEPKALRVYGRKWPVGRDRVWPIFSNPDEPHRVLASLDLPLYITTNYDSYMYLALKHLGKGARREICQWYKGEERETGKRVVGGSGTSRPEPTPENPLVYHLHGHFGKPESMVLTEDDYIDFLINVSKYEVIPKEIEVALERTAFLFVGYSLEDINFRFLFRKLAERMRGGTNVRHVSVQLQPRQYETPEKLRLRARKQLEYLQKHFRTREVKVYWGPADEFARELRRRWEDFNP